MTLNDTVTADILRLHDFYVRLVVPYCARGRPAHASWTWRRANANGNISDSRMPTHDAVIQGVALTECHLDHRLDELWT